MWVVDRQYDPPEPRYFGRMQPTGGQLQQEHFPAAKPQRYGLPPAVHDTTSAASRCFSVPLKGLLVQKPNTKNRSS